MNMQNITKTKRKYAALGALLVTATVSAPASAENEAATPFTMAVISNEAYGQRVTSGEFDQAIDNITAGGRRSRDRFADQNNLCVAYTKTSEIKKARIACNAAVARVKKQASWRRTSASDYSGKGQAYRADLTVALSNRGVLLAATGDAELARKDFLAAIELQTRSSSIAESNLERLEQLTTPDA